MAHRVGWGFISLYTAAYMSTSLVLIAPPLVRERPQYTDLDDASRPLALFRRSKEAVQEPGLLVNGALGTLVLISRHEQAGQGDVLELAQVAEVVIDGQALLTRPAESFTSCPARSISWPSAPGPAEHWERSRPDTRAPPR